MYRIGVDIGGTKINVGLFDYNNKKMLCVNKTFVKDIDSVVLHIRNSVVDLCNRFNITINDIEGCGIGIPGTISDDGKRILKAPNIETIPEDISFQLEKILNIPVKLIQDSRAAAYGEYIMSGSKFKLLVCITLGTGIGTGIVFDGKIFTGALGTAGELGHLPIIEQGRVCGCGKKGCLEKYCAGGGLDITASEIYGVGETAHRLFLEAKAGNTEAMEALDYAVKTLGAGLVSVINLFSPDALLFSGGLSEQEELYLNPLIEYIKDHCYTAENKPIITKAMLGEYSPLYGAAFI
jgi:glucokinase